VSNNFDDYRLFMYRCREFDLKKLLLYAVFVGILLSFGSQALAAQVPDGFVLVKGGTFTMGSPANEAQRSSNEFQRQVTVSSFYMGKYEVTQAEYLELMGRNPSLSKGDKLPVEQVTWFNAVAYCNALSEKEGLDPAYTISGQAVTWDRSANGYRLPTEAEWEYACRGGTATPFFTGNNITSDQANYNGTIPYGSNARTAFRGRSMQVGSFRPNAIGLYDMHGNVAEWCWDWNGEYARGEQTDPAGQSTPSGYKIFRGGGWNHPADFLRSARRAMLNPVQNGYYLGFRVARNAPADAGDAE
jgi:formylglycine-generating enzyme required for sulfatase activity